MTHVGGLIENIERAASLVADEADEGPGTLETVAREITDLELWTKRTPEYRPLVTLVSLFKGSATQIVRLFDTSINALKSRDIATAQRFERQIQKAIDEATLAIEAVSSLLRGIRRIAESTNPIGAWLDEAVGGDIFVAVERGRVTLDRHDITAKGFEAPLLAEIFETIIGLISDSNRFWSAVHKHVDLLGIYRSDLLALVRSEPFAARNDAVMHDILHTARRAISMSTPQSIREEITELLDEGFQLMEQPFKLYLGLACTMVGRMSFDESQGAYMSELINTAKAEGWDHILEFVPFSIDLRNAFAHRDYEVTDDGMVRLSPGRRAKQNRAASILSYEEICDAVIALMEACSVMQIALTVVLDDDVEQISIRRSPFLVGTLIEGLLGWTNVDFDVLEQEVIVSANCPNRIRIANIAVIASFFRDRPGNLNLKLNFEKDSKKKVIKMPLPKFALWDETQDEFDKMVAFLDLCYHTTHNDEPVITLDHIRKFVALSILRLLADEADAKKESMSRPSTKSNQQITLPQSPKQFANLLAVLKRWEKTARRLKIPDLAEAIQDAIRWRSSLQTNLITSNSRLDHLFRLMELEIDHIQTDIDVQSDDLLNQLCSEHLDIGDKDLRRLE